MNSEALRSLMDDLGMDCETLAAQLGGRPDHYERLCVKKRLPFPVWDALQRFAHREGYAWDRETRHWRKAGNPVSTA